MFVDDLWPRLTYCPDTGQFTSCFTGRALGSLRNDGYWRIRIKGREYQAAPLAFFWMTGRWVLVDHRDSNPLNNRWSNLREATPRQNMANRRVRCDSRAGVKGVRFKRGRWEARIRIGGERRHLGSFDSCEAAAAAYAYAAADAYGEFMRL